MKPAPGENHGRACWADLSPGRAGTPDPGARLPQHHSLAPTRPRHGVGAEQDGKQVWPKDSQPPPPVFPAGSACTCSPPSRQRPALPLLDLEPQFSGQVGSKGGQKSNWCGNWAKTSLDSFAAVLPNGLLPLCVGVPPPPQPSSFRPLHSSTWTHGLCTRSAPPHAPCVLPHCAGAETDARGHRVQRGQSWCWSLDSCPRAVLTNDQTGWLRSMWCGSLSSPPLSCVPPLLA